MKILKQEKNPFLEREEIVIEFQQDTTPSFEEVKQTIGKDPVLTVVKKVNTNFGRKTFLAEAVVYNTIEAKKKIEVIPKKLKKKMQEEEKAAAEAAKKAAAEAKATEEAAKATEAETAEQPAEEKNEETKPEEQAS
jgi:ribosomal protein S24E